MELSANMKSDGSSPTHLPKCSNRSYTLFLQTAWISFHPDLNSCGLSSAGYALVKSSNCKVFCTQPGHCFRYNTCQSQDDMQSIPLHQGSCQIGQCIVTTPPTSTTIDHNSKQHIYSLVHPKWGFGSTSADECVKVEKRCKALAILSIPLHRGFCQIGQCIVTAPPTNTTFHLM